MYIMRTIYKDWIRSRNVNSRKEIGALVSAGRCMEVNNSTFAQIATHYIFGHFNFMVIIQSRVSEPSWWHPLSMSSLRSCALHFAHFKFKSLLCKVFLFAWLRFFVIHEHCNNGNGNISLCYYRLNIIFSQSERDENSSIPTNISCTVAT